MLKPYTSPQITFAQNLPESNRRELLALLLLAPPENTAVSRKIYTHSLHLLFDTECEAILENCRLANQGLWTLQPYRADLFTLAEDILLAGEALGVPLSFQMHGYPLDAAVYPRPLQLSLLCLLRAALIHGKTYATVTVEESCFQLRITALQTLKQSRDLYLAKQVAALHGGRLLTGGCTAALQFRPEIQISAVPRWHAPGADGLLRDPLSFVNAGLHSFISSED